MELIKKSIERSVKQILIDQGNYHTAYRSVIDVFADMVCEYMRLTNIDSKSHTLNEIADVLIKDIASYGEMLKIDEQLIKCIIAENKARLLLSEGR